MSLAVFHSTERHTIRQCLLALPALSGFKWHMTDAGTIYGRKEHEYFCPLTALAAASFNRPFDYLKPHVAARALRVERWRELNDAASGSSGCALRAELLLALGF